MEDAPFVGRRRDHLPLSFRVGRDKYMGYFVAMCLADSICIHFDLLGHL